MYTISEAARQTGIPASTIRFYDKNGLLPGIRRTSAGNRLFSEADILELEEIAALLSCGFSIREMKEYTAASPARRAEMLTQRKEQLYVDIQAIQTSISLLDTRIAEQRQLSVQ